MHAPAGPDEVKLVGAETFVVGAASVTISGLATVASGPNMSPGPMLVTATFQVITDPAGMNVEELVLVTRRSYGTTLVPAEAERLAVTPMISPVPLVEERSTTDAWLVMLAAGIALSNT